MFDIKRTSREALDFARRALYQSSLDPAISTDSAAESDDNDPCDIDQLGAEERCKVGLQ